MDFLPLSEFRKCVARYRGEYKVQKFSCLDQFLCMAFAQLTYRESLRDIEAVLRAAQPKLYHMGIRCRVSRSTLADANETRDWRIYADFAQILIAEARQLYAGEDFGVELEQTAYALDSTTIDLCLALFPWAKFRKRKGAVKMHTLLDLRGSIPALVIITHGKIHDVNILDELPLEPGAIYIMDRAYVDFNRLHSMTQSLAFFITRAKKRFDFKRVCSRPVDKQTGLQCDQTIVLNGVLSKKKYPNLLKDMEQVIQESLRRADDFVLVLPNEIVIVLPNCTKDNAMRLVEARLEPSIREHLGKKELNKAIKVFFGCVSYPVDGRLSSDLIEKARNIGR